jgi:hypothetical protein
MFKSSRKNEKQTPDRKSDLGLLVFESTTEVIQAEMVLKKAGFKVQVMGPPPEIQTGCDMVLQFDLNQELAIHRELRKNNLEPIQVIPVDGPLLKPVDLFQAKDFGRYLMVRAANMSGGGCPDVPFLAQLMIGKNLKDAPQPVEYGSTLCGYALQLAYEELVRRCS